MSSTTYDNGGITIEWGGHPRRFIVTLRDGTEYEAESKLVAYAFVGWAHLHSAAKKKVDPSNFNPGTWNDAAPWDN